MRVKGLLLAGTIFMSMVMFSNYAISSSLPDSGDEQSNLKNIQNAEGGYESRLKALEVENIKLSETVKNLNDNKKDTLEILEKVNSFYTNSFSSLQNIIFAIIAFLGVILPLAISFYQTRKLKLEKDNLEKAMLVEFNASILAIEVKIQNEQRESIELIDSEFKKAIGELKKEINEQLNTIKSEYKGLLFHSMASTFAREKLWGSAIKYCLMAARFHINAGSENNLKKILALLITILKSKVKDKEHLENNNRGYDLFIKSINKYNKKSIYDVEIDEVKRRWESIINSGVTPEAKTV